MVKKKKKKKTQRTQERVQNSCDQRDICVRAIKVSVYCVNTNSTPFHQIRNRKTIPAKFLFLRSYFQQSCFKNRK